MDFEDTNTESRLPPGTTRLEDLVGDTVFLKPSPTSDPNDPLNWSPHRKAVQTTLLSFYTTFVFASLTVGIPNWELMNADLGVSYDNLSNGFAVNLAALAIGCWLVVPLALRYGRRPVYLGTAFVLFASNVWQSCIQSTGEYFGSQFLCGIAGAINETLFQVTITDLFFVHQRGSIQGLYLICVTIGNYLAPVATGYVGASQGWRWSYRYCAIFIGIIALLMTVFLEETAYAPALEGLPTQQPLPQTSHPAPGADTKKDVATATDNEPADVPDTSVQPAHTRRAIPINHSIPLKSRRQRLALITPSPHPGHSIRQHYAQPLSILFTLPAITFTALQYGISIATLSILATTTSLLYPLPPYHFSTIGIGNMNIPPLIGSILGALYGGPLVDRFILFAAKRWNQGVYEPEMRLCMYPLPALALPAGVLLYGLALAHGRSWVVSAVGAGLVGFGVGGVGDISLTYALDAYTDVIGDAFVAVAAVRNLLAMVLVFVLPRWLQGMGTGRAFGLLGGLIALLVLTCVPMVVWGRELRRRSAGRYRDFAAKQYGARRG